MKLLSASTRDAADSQSAAQTCFNQGVKSSSKNVPLAAEQGAPGTRVLAAVAALSAAVMGFEIALTRLFAILLRYHFAFLVISMALCGLGLGGYLAHFLSRKIRLSLPSLAAWFGASIALALGFLLFGVFAHFPEAYWISALVVLIPFTLAGLFLAEAFSRYARFSGRLYAWDLGGAALAACGIVALMQLTSSINAALLMGALAAFAGFLCLEKPREYSQPSKSDSNDRFLTLGLTALLFAAALLNNGKTLWLDIPAVPPRPDADNNSLSDRGITQELFTELGTEDHTSRIVDTRWNAFARTDVVRDAPDDTDSFLIYTNGNVPTNMLRWDGKLESIGPKLRNFPLIDWAFSVAPIGENAGAKNAGASTREAAQDARRGRVLSIGPGGGLDALMALHYGAARFDGAEINPSIVGLMRDYKDFNGGIYQRKDVHVVTAEGRAFVREARQSRQKYDFLYSALTKTATAAQGTALLESFIYTQDAFADYWDTLSDDGQLAIVTDQPMLMARLFSTTLAMMKSRGINERAACRHLALMSAPPDGPYVYALVLQKSPMSDTQTYAMSHNAFRRGLRAIWIPGRESTPNFGPFDQVGSGTMSLQQFIDWWKTPVEDDPMRPKTALDVSPCPDDRPFVLDLNLGTLPVFKNLIAFTMALSLVLAALGWTTAPRRDAASTREVHNESAALSDTEARDETDGAPHAEPNYAELDSAASTRGREEAPSHDFTRGAIALFYFALLGVGFMLVEIPLSQKLILPLGYPTLSLTVILFSVLLGGGAGSWFSQRFRGERLQRHAMLCALGVAIFTACGVMVLGAASNALLAIPLALRIVLVGLSLLPLGFLLGTPFPAGMRLFPAPLMFPTMPTFPILTPMKPPLRVLAAAPTAQEPSP